MIKVLFIIFIFFQNIKTYSSIDTSYQYDQISAEKSSKNFNGNTKENRLNISYVHDVEDWKKLEWSVFLSYTAPDYSNYQLKDSSGNFYQFSDRYSDDDYFTTSFSVGKYLLRSLKLETSITKSIGTEQFESTSYLFGLILDLYSSTSIIEFYLNYKHQQYPLNYFTHPQTFKIVAYPEENTTKVFMLNWEQVISRRLKSFSTFKISQSNALRPFYYELGFHMSMAINNTFFSKLGIDHGEESTSETLKNDTGYLSHTTYKIELNYEPVFDLLLSLSYYLDIEVEDDQRIGKVTQTAFDQYGFGIHYTSLNFSPYLQMSLVESNKSDQNIKLVLGSKWDF